MKVQVVKNVALYSLCNIVHGSEYGCQLHTETLQYLKYILIEYPLQSVLVLPS